MPLASRAPGVLLALLLSATVSAAPSTPSVRPCACAAARSVADTTRVIRIALYDQTHMRPAGVAALLEAANRIWNPYGVSLEIGSAGTDAVTVVVRGGATRALEDVGAPVLGVTTFSNGHATPYINLSRPAALEAAVRAELGGIRFNARPPAQQDAILVQMLGVALAHEIGHYLLDSKQHSGAGLMQLGLSVRQLTAPETTRLRLTPQQQERLCAVRDAEKPE